MKKIIVLIFASFLSIKVFAEDGFSVFGLSFVTPTPQFPSYDEAVYGLRFSLISGGHSRMIGIAPSSIFNSDDTVGGIQIASFINDANNAELGVWQIAGFVNRVEGDCNGVQIAGVFNGVSGYMIGIQISTFNSVGGDCNGVQIGFANINEKHTVRGMQIGVHNVAKTLKGVQIGVFNNCNEDELYILNFNVDTVRGMQIGFFNVAKTLEGVQIGVINEAKTLKGVQIGVINVTESRALPILNIAW